MTTTALRAAVALALVACAAFAIPARADTITRRFALVVAAHDGGVERPRLRYAGDDARAVANVLTEFGGVLPGDLRLLVDEDRHGVEAAFAALHDEVSEFKAQHDARAEVVVYYSGHSDEEGLLLGEERLPYRAVREIVALLPVDVRVVVLDSCASGALVRAKGGTRRPAFLVDTAVQLSGHAFLTSASATESAQESDRLQGSFFTHALVAGLRGAADTSGDGTVTLGEAYHFAFSETLARTERTQAGAQHPTWDIQLQGKGDLVLTDLRASSARLILESALVGRTYVDDARGRVVVEVDKAAGRPLSLSLPPGRYTVTVAHEGSAWGGEAALAAGLATTLSPSSLQPVSLQKVATRGDAPLIFFPINLAFLSPLEINSYAAGRPVNALSLGLVFARAAQVNGLNLSLGGSWVTEQMTGAQVSLGFNGARDVVGGAFALGANLATGDVWGLQAAVGANLGLGAVTGAQLAVLANYAQGDVSVLQLSAANIGLGRAVGLQAGLFNLHHESLGAQVGLVNVGGTVTGAQVGLVNIADDVVGTQVGLVNIARKSTAPVGLLSFVDDGIATVGLVSSDLTLGGAQARLGGRFVYSTFLVGANPLLFDAKAAGVGADFAPGVTAQLGTGVQLPFLFAGHDAAVAGEVLVGTLHPQFLRRFVDPRFELLTSAHLLVSLRPLPFLNVSAGPTLRLWLADDSLAGALDPALSLRQDLGSALQLVAWPGFMVRVEL